tara:strand:+ start:1384 stop:2316 length:933 start_codon:yes stop_codon:yes gene_type:complete
MISPIDVLPKHKYDSIHYKLIYQIEQLFNKKDHPNIIIYGKKRCGKTTIIRLLFNELFEWKKESENNNNFHMINYGMYYYFDCKNIINKNEFIEYLKTLCKSKDYSEKHKYIILDSFEDVNYHIQNCLKVILEKSSVVSKFIIISINMNFIIPALRSRCLNIGISEPKFYDKYIYLKNVFTNNNIIFNKSLLLNDCRESTIEDIINKYLSNDNYKNIKSYYVDEIIDLFYKPFSLNKLRDLSQILKELDLSEIINYELIDRLQLIIKEKKLIMIIKEIAQYNHIIQKSYRDILFIESLLIRIYNIINELL